MNHKGARMEKDNTDYKLDELAMPAWVMGFNHTAAMFIPMRVQTFTTLWNASKRGQGDPRLQNLLFQPMWPPKDPNSTCHADYAVSVFLQIESDLDSKLPLLDVVNSSFPSWAANNLSAVLLPPLPPVVPPPSSRSRPRAPATPLNKPAPVVKKDPKRPSLRYFEEHFILFCMGRKKCRKILFLAILSQ